MSLKSFAFLVSLIVAFATRSLMVRHSSGGSFAFLCGSRSYCLSLLLLLLLAAALPPSSAFSGKCYFSDSPELSLTAGKIDLFEDGFLQIGRASGGSASLGAPGEASSSPKIAPSLFNDDLDFTSYAALVASVEDALTLSSVLEDPILAEFQHAIDMVEQYGVALETIVERHPGYGMENLLRQVVGTAPSSPEHDLALRYMREGVVDIPKARVFDPTYNCTAGFSLMNSSLASVAFNESRVVYTDAEYDHEGGYDVEKCPVYDDELGCYVDPTYEQHAQGECCRIPPYTRRAILVGQDQYYSGTCEADIICSDGGVTEAKPCGDGFICDEKTTAESAMNYPCAPGYVCGFGTTPDPSLHAPASQFDKLCSERYECGAGTGLVEERDLPCPPNYFCPTGTSEARLGMMANDALNRGLNQSSENESRLLIVLDESLNHTQRYDPLCLSSINESLADEFEVRWKRPGDDIDNSHLEYLVRVADRNNDGIIDPPYISDPNVASMPGAARPSVTRVADRLASKCERDSKSYFVADAIRRDECNCTQQLFALAAVYRLWQCTSTEPLADFGLGALKVPVEGRGHRDFWFDRIHRDYDLAIAMDPAMEGYGLKWSEEGQVCRWSDDDALSLTAGKIPGFDGGLLSIEDETNAGLSFRFTWLEDRTFGTYEELKNVVYEEYDRQRSFVALSDDPIDPFVFDLRHAVRMIEQFGARLELLISFREALPEERRLPWGESRSSYNFSLAARELLPGRLSVCACQNMLRCPNGTHFHSFGAASINDCNTNGNEILRRVSLLPPYTSEIDNLNKKISNGTEYVELGGGHSMNTIGTIRLEPLEVGIFQLDLTGLPRNMTYAEHYRLAVYVNCMPCPVRYRCEEPMLLATRNRGKQTPLSPQCSFPTGKRQAERLNECLRSERRQVCVLADGSDADVEWCREQTDERDDFLLYTEPDLDKCLSMPYFCADTKWNYRTFRRLCQEKLPDGGTGSPYDCTLSDRWEDYSRWSDSLCCSATEDPLFQSLSPCINGTCSDDEAVQSILQNKFSDKFQLSHGFVPPVTAPNGSFIMDAGLQEARDHPSPLDLFNEWQSGGPASNETLKPHNIHRPNESADWKRHSGCCRCRPHPLPAYFSSTSTDDGFPDDKHQQVQFTITALAEVELVIVVELLHGQFYPDFDEYFSTYDKSLVRVHSPSRFVNLGKDMGRATWMAVLNRDTIGAAPLELPLNLPMTMDRDGRRLLEERVLIDRPTALEVGRFDLLGLDLSANGTTTSPTHAASSNNREPMPILDDHRVVEERSQWWDNIDSGDYSTAPYLALPYLPFMSNCRGYDSHISISRLLEEHPDCNLVAETETVPIRQYRLFERSPAVSDTCHAQLTCLYEEDLTNPRRGYRWYEASRDQVLFHLTSDAITASEFSAEVEGGGADIVRGWGRGPEIGRLLRDSSHELIPVRVDFLRDSMSNVIPRIIELELEYYQINKGQKRLVEASIKFDDLCTTLQPRQYGGNAALLEEMGARGIEPCEIDVSTGQLLDAGYILKVNFHPLSWHRLMNRFQFSALVYLIVFTLVGIIAALLAAMVWTGSRFMTKLRFPPKLRGLDLAILAARPALYGVSLALVPTILCLTFVSIPANSLRALDGTWMMGSVLDLSFVQSNHTGRIGSAFLSVGIYLSILSVRALVPDFERQRLADKPFLAPPSGINTLENDEDDTSSSSIWTPAFWRRCHVLLTSMALQFILLAVLEYSFSSEWEKHIFKLIVLFKFVHLVLEQLLGWILKETLLAAPLLAVSRITSVVLTMGSADFTDFTLSYYISLALMIVERLFIGPAIKRIKILLPRWRIMLSRRWAPSRLRPKTDGEITREEATWRKANEQIEMHCEGIEPLLESLGQYSIDSIANLLVPFILSFFMAFYKQTCVAAKYGVEANELDYYTMFAFFVVPFGVLIDVLILNAQELMYGWRIFDYIDYQRYRFATRKCRWMLNSPNVDESITESLQTLDLMCLSSQYYFLSSVFVVGALLNMLGITVFLRAEFNMFGDPGTPIVATSMLLVCEGIRRTLSRLCNMRIDHRWRGLWSLRVLEGVMDDTLAAKLQVGDGSQGVLEQERLELQALKSEKFRTRWLERNRPWLLTHLYELIPKEVIRALDPSAVETLRDLQSDVVRIGQGLRKPTDVRSEISSDSEEEEEERERHRRWERQPLRGTDQLSMARTWITAARKRLRFEKVTRGIREGALDNACHNCGRGPGNLTAHGLDGLIQLFESKYVGTDAEDAENLDLWKAFYRRNAFHYSICSKCSAFKPSPEEVEQRVARGFDISSSDEDDDDGPKFSEPVQLSGEAGGVAREWLQKARIRLEDGWERSPMSIPSAGTPSVGASASEILEMDGVARSLLTSWVEHARKNNRVKTESRGEEIRFEIKKLLSRMPASNDWLFGSLRDQGKNLEGLGEALATKRAALASQRDSDIQAIRSTLSKIETDCAAELQAIDADEKKDLDGARTQLDHDLKERRLELTTAGLGEDAQEEAIAREMGRTVPALVQQEVEIKDRHQIHRDLLNDKLATARANAEAANANLHSRFGTATSAAEREFRAEALRWIEVSKRRLQVLESEGRK